ncbi:histidine kinase [Pseudonocardia benzenivorans]
MPTTESATAPAVARLQQVRGGQEALVRRLTLFAPVVLVLFVVAAYYAAPGLGLRGPALLVTVSTALFVVAVLGRNATTARSPAHLGFVGVLVATSVALMCVQPAGPGPAGMLLAVLCVARLLPVRVGVPVLVVGFVGLEVFETVTGQQYVTILVLGSLAALYGLMYLAHRLVAANRQAERLLAELHESRLAQAQAAGLAERQRLAREMHDVLAHSLSGLMLQLEGPGCSSRATRRTRGCARPSSGPITCAAPGSTRHAARSAPCATTTCPAPNAYRRWPRPSGATTASRATTSRRAPRRSWGRRPGSRSTAWPRRR